jgi:signal transduction histidine kinase
MHGKPSLADEPGAEACMAKIRETYRTGVPYQINEARFSIEQAGGTTSNHFFNLCYQPLRNAQGEVDSVVSFAVEVTEQVEARTRAEALAKEAEEANRTKDEFLAMLGHELRNPLAPILSALEMMKLRDAEYFARERAIIERQVKYVMRLVDDLLDVSRIAQGKISLERNRVDLAKCVFTGIELSRPLLTQHRHRLLVHMKEGLNVIGDSMRLAQVFANLLTNAAKYTPPQGEIEVGSDVTDAEVRIWVRDTGIGIRQEILDTMFGLFVQERQAIDRSGGGLGLGLAIVRSLVDLHGGSVEAESPGPGLGSTFTVRIPLAPPEAEPAELPSLRASESDNVARKILVVDDNADAAELLADALRYLGHHVTTAPDGHAALELLDTLKPDLALLDIGLPGGMDGFELARRIRAHPMHSALQLIAVTGYGDGKARQTAQEAGFNGHFTKPVDLSVLLDVISRPLSS